MKDRSLARLHRFTMLRDASLLKVFCDVVWKLKRKAQVDPMSLIETVLIVEIWNGTGTYHARS